MTEFQRAVPKAAARLITIPNGEKRNRITAAILKGLGVTAGVSDQILILPAARVVWIEIKLARTPRHNKTYLSSNQRDFRDEVEAMGHVYRVVRSLDEFWLVLREFAVPYRFAPPDITLGRIPPDAIAPRE